MSSAPPPYGPVRPPEEPSGYQPFEQYYRPPQPPQRPRRTVQRNGLLGGLLTLLVAAWAYGKYAVVFLLKFGTVKTLLTLLVSLGVYAAWFRSWWFAVGLVIMLLIHEMGHVVEIRRQGIPASAPIFIPLLGALILQRRHPTDALHQAQIGIAGPLAGTVGATVAFALYGETHWHFFLLWAGIGFFLNLFNLIPLGFLDGAWIMGVVSKWFQILGLALIVAGVVYLGIPVWFVLVLLLWMGPAIIERFRNDRLPYYQAVPVPARLAMGAAWLFLAGYLGFALLQTIDLIVRVR